MKKNIIYASLSVLILVSSCKKDSEIPIQKINSQTSSSRTKSDLINYHDGDIFSFIAYLNKLPEKTAIDTLKKFLTNHPSITNSNKTSSAFGKNAFSTVHDPSTSTPEEIATYNAPLSSFNYYASDVPIWAVPGTTIQKVETWIVAQQIWNFWRVVSTEQLEITYVPNGFNKLKPVFTNFSHSGSQLVTDGPILIGSWSENLNAHFPLTFGENGADLIVSSVGGVYNFGLSTPISNYTRFYAHNY